MTSTTLPVTNDLNALPQLIENNKLRVARIKEHAKGLVEAASSKLDAEIDVKLSEGIKAYNVTLADINEKRMPITRKLDELKKQFTEQENEIKSCVSSLSAFRDKYVKQVAEEAEKARREAQLKQYKDQELINIKSAVELEIRNYVTDQITLLKKGVMKAMETVTKENYSEKYAKLKAMPIVLKFDGYKTAQSSKYDHDVNNIVLDTMTELKTELTETYVNEITEYKQGALMHMANMDKMSDDERKASIEAANETIAIEAESAKEIAEVKTEISNNAAMADLAMSSITPDADIPENRQGYKIAVLSKDGYSAIVGMWFNLFGALNSLDKFDKKTLGSMVKDMEAHAHKTGEKIEHKSLSYEIVYKAVNRK